MDETRKRKLLKEIEAALQVLFEKNGIASVQQIFTNIDPSSIDKLTETSDKLNTFKLSADIVNNLSDRQIWDIWLSSKTLIRLYHNERFLWNGFYLPGMGTCEKMEYFKEKLASSLKAAVAAFQINDFILFGIYLKRQEKSIQLPRLIFFMVCENFELCFTNSKSLKVAVLESFCQIFGLTQCKPVRVSGMSCKEIMRSYHSLKYGANSVEAVSLKLRLRPLKVVNRQIEDFRNIKALREYANMCFGKNPRQTSELLLKLETETPFKSRLKYSASFKSHRGALAQSFKNCMVNNKMSLKLNKNILTLFSSK